MGHGNQSLVRAVATMVLFYVLAAAPSARAFDVVNASLGDHVVHAAAEENITKNATLIDHPLTNGNQDAVIFVTQNLNPGNDGGTYNDHNEGFWYSYGYDQWAVFNQDLAVMPPGADFNILVASSAAGAFVHTATVGNIIGNTTFIDHPLANGHPDAILTVAQNWNPEEIDGVYNDHPFGVFYDGLSWAIFNQDIAAMPEGASFNVLIDPEDSSILDGQTLSGTAFVHTATAGNSMGHLTVLDHPLINDNPDAVVIATQNWNPGGGGGTYNNHAIGVWYSYGDAYWAVFNQDFGAMPLGASFNIQVLAQETDLDVHVATVENTENNFTNLDNPITNENPDAIVMVTQIYDPYGEGGGVYNDHNEGIWYHYLEDKWSVFNQDLGTMPLGAAFNILLPGHSAVNFVHPATAGNTFGNSTILDHPSTDNNPDAIVFVTQNWNPGGGEGIYNDNAMGVWYTGSQWSVFNQNFVNNLPIGSYYNVLVCEAEENVFVHTANVGNIFGHLTIIDNPATNNNPDALLTVTQNYNPGGIGGVYNDHAIGVWYNLARWKIFNQDNLSPMPENASFNVLVGSPPEASSVDGSGTAATAIHLQNYPNPFGTTTNIRFTLAEPAHVSLKIFDVTGRRVTTLIEGVLGAGMHDTPFDGNGLASGRYFYRLHARPRAGRAIVEMRDLLLAK